MTKEILQFPVLLQPMLPRAGELSSPWDFKLIFQELEILDVEKFKREDTLRGKRLIGY